MLRVFKSFPEWPGIRQRRSAVVLIIAGLILAMAIAIAAVLLTADLQKRSVQTTNRNLTSMSAILADQADRAVQAIELVQDAVIDDIVGDGPVSEADYLARLSTRATHDMLKARIAALPQVNAVTLIDQNGNLINFSRYWPIPAVNISDRDYFKAIVADPHLKRFISAPVPNRGNGAQTMYIARRLEGPDGTFLGLVLAAVELTYFQKLYGEILQRPDDVVSIFRTDGMLLVRYPGRDDAIGQVFPDSGASRIFAAGAPQGGLTRVVSPIDGADRLVATRTLAHYPLVLSVSSTASSSLAAWRAQTGLLGGASLLLILGVLSVLVLGIREMRSRDRLAAAEAARGAAEAHAQGERALREQHETFRTALDNMAQGLCMFDDRDDLIVANRRFAEMYGLPPHLREPGTTFQMLRTYLTRVGAGAASDRMDREDRRAGTLAPSSFTCELADGRAISILHSPIPGAGWVYTHEDVTERRQSEARIAHMARHDGLTDLPNRSMLREHLAGVLADWRANATVAVFLLDLDGFKGVNDALGHRVGDELLRAVAVRLRDSVNASDLVSRLGGDEFAVVRNNVGDGEAVLFADHLVAALGLPFRTSNHDLTIGTSLGIVVAESGSATADELLQNADIALYRAKAAGRGQACLFERRMADALQTRRLLEADLHSALAGGQLELHYQPVVRTDGLKMTACEALLRWRHPVRGMISPAEFIPLAEESGLIRDIGAWVLNQACADAAQWPSDIRVAVNISSVQFPGGRLVDDIKTALARSGLAPDRLELEITESVILHSTETVSEILNVIHDLNVTIAMDDFGTGYSSLSYLHQFPFDKLKIDQSFVRDLDKAADRVEIVRAVVALGKALGMSVLAEGVETDAQRQILAGEGCDELQGYLFSRPVPRAQLETLFADWGARQHGMNRPMKEVVYRPDLDVAAA